MQFVRTQNTNTLEANRRHWRKRKGPGPQNECSVFTGVYHIPCIYWVGSRETIMCWKPENLHGFPNFTGEKASGTWHQLITLRWASNFPLFLRHATTSHASASRLPSESASTSVWMQDIQPCLPHSWTAGSILLHRHKDWPVTFQVALGITKPEKNPQGNMPQMSWSGIFF